MSVLNYSLKFTKLSKYAPSFVSNPSYEMSCFLTVVFDDLVEACYSAMLHDSMIISYLMVHAQQVEETRLRRNSREAKKARSYEGGSSKGRPEIQDKPRLKKSLSNQVPSKFPNAHDDRVSNPKSQNLRDTSSPSKKSTCGMCGKKHYGDCLVET